MRGDAFDLYEGTIRVMDPDGQIAEEWDAPHYQEHIAERVLANSYANSPYLTRLGPERGSYRVGPLARLNMAGMMTGHRSDSLLDEYRRTLGRPVHAVLAYHWARMIELVASAERMAFILEDDEILSDNFRVPVERGGGVGIAAIEAPRGTLIHHYEADPVGKVTKANLVVATTHNIASIDDAVLKAVQGTPYGSALTNETFRRMELGIRAHDPCLSCATHEVGRMPLVIELIGPDGSLIGERGVE
jgi:coenzyme F420-reducing hydrogenase alpha subunit